MDTVCHKIVNNINHIYTHNDVYIKNIIGSRLRKHVIGLISAGLFFCMCLFYNSLNYLCLCCKVEIERFGSMSGVPN